MVGRLLRRSRWLLARRAVQALVLASFVATPWWDVPPARGTLASSRWFDAVPLSDPMVALQAWLAGTPPVAAVLIGAALVAAFYALVAGRLFCAWVCPVNLVTDAADALRRATGLRSRAALRADRRLRYGVLAAVLLGSALTGTVLWETVNPIGWTMRGVTFGLWSGALVAIVAIVAFDVLVLRHGWCGHVCPVGAFYALLGRFGGLKVEAVRASACTRCGDCFEICPEVQVIVPVLKPGAAVTTIADADCLRCGRCLDVCDEDVFAFRFDARGFPSSQ